MKQAWFTLLAMGLTLAGLSVWVGNAPLSLTAQDHLVALVPESERSQWAIAGVSIDGLPQGERFLFVRDEGTWSCPSVFGAVASSLEIEALIAEVTQAWGEPVADAAEREVYGFNLERPLLLRLYGPGVTQDPEASLLLELELGSSLPGLGEGRSYVRVKGSADLLEIDQNPRKRITQAEGSERLPPLLDRRLLAGEWPSLGEGIERAFIDYADGVSIEVRSRVLGPAPSPKEPPPREWVALQGESTARILPYRIGGWQSFLYHVEYQGLANPQLADKRGLDKPQAHLTLMQVDQDPIELVIGRSAPSGQAFVLNKKTKMLCLIDAEHIAQLLPDVPALCSREQLNPWEAWLPK